MLLVVKLGGSAVTDKARPFLFKEQRAELFARELARVLEAGSKAVVVHGGGSFGHPVASKYRLHEGGLTREKLLGFAETRYWMNELNQRIVSVLLRHGIPAVAVQTSAIALMEGGSLRELSTAPVERLLGMGLVPVLYGDVVPDLSRGVAILSGDMIAVHLACALRASALVFLVGSGGVYSKPPGTPGAYLVRELGEEDMVDVGESRGVDVTGGLRQKLECAFKAARCGARVAIGGVEHLWEMALGVDAPYTRIRASRE
ncbi:MAG: isopentenyl phosphate kinase family protein [Thermofilum sp.]|nr:isopentenyl phosphate kinase family protein [Thermofilum sp.]